MTDRDGGIKLDARTVPFPRSISTEAQDVLRRSVGEDGVPLNARYTMPPVDDLEGWATIKAAADKSYTAFAEAVGPSLRSEVETIKADQALIHVATPPDEADPGCAIIDVHGGAFIAGGGEASRVSARKQSDHLGVRCYGVDYRMPPEYPYPAALDDCLTTYRLALRNHEAGKIIVSGRSAGGNMAAAMLLRARDEGLPLPSALILLSPQVDLTETGDSFEVNRMIDVVLPGSLMTNNRLYAAGTDLSHPYLSPLFGNLAGFPPTFLQSGTRDLFLSNTVRMHRALRSAGVEAELHVFEAMPHGGFAGNTPEDLQLLAEIKRFASGRFQFSS